MDKHERQADRYRNHIAALDRLVGAQNAAIAAERSKSDMLAAKLSLEGSVVDDRHNQLITSLNLMGISVSSAGGVYLVDAAELVGKARRVQTDDGLVTLMETGTILFEHARGKRVGPKIEEHDHDDKDDETPELQF